MLNLTLVICLNKIAFVRIVIFELITTIKRNKDKQNFEYEYLKEAKVFNSLYVFFKKAR